MPLATARELRRPETALVHSGIAIYAGAAAIGAIESVVPGGPSFSPVPGVVALIVTVLISLFGARVPRNALFAAGPLGAAMIAWAVATSPGASDAAILYSWPVLWVSCFYGTRQTIAVVLSVGVAHAVALVILPDGNVDRWCDVMVSAAIVAGVVRSLAARNAKLFDRLTAESRIDPLTGLLNRRGLEERFAVEIARAVRERRPLAVVAIDVDHFKRVNDAHGHQAGDRALVWLSSMLCELTRGADIVARVGGEEFVIVLPGADGPSTLEFAERLRAAIESGDAEIPFTISAGVASALAPSTAHTLLGAADRALYAAKHAGRNRVSYTRS
jgi:diguanylate cyclase (GGDEF)-like protein